MPAPLKTVWYSPPSRSSTARRALSCKRRIWRSTSRGSMAESGAYRFANSETVDRILPGLPPACRGSALVRYRAVAPTPGRFRVARVEHALHIFRRHAAVEHVLFEGGFYLDLPGPVFGLAGRRPAAGQDRDGPEGQAAHDTEEANQLATVQPPQ